MTHLKQIWALVSLAILAITLVNYDGSAKSDVDIFLVYTMLVLSFPTGLIAFVAVFYGIALLGTPIEVSYAYLMSAWAILCVSSYLQWFVVVPWLWRRLARREIRGNQ